MNVFKGKARISFLVEVLLKIIRFLEVESEKDISVKLKTKIN